MKNSYKFFENLGCKYYPCHSGIKKGEFNCLYCFCPIFVVCKRHSKSGCEFCKVPHDKGSYKFMMLELNNMVLHRRSDDPKGSDFGKLRNGR